VCLSLLTEPIFHSLPYSPCSRCPIAFVSSLSPSSSSSSSSSSSVTFQCILLGNVSFSKDIETKYGRVEKIHGLVEEVGRTLFV
jgi:hypothetical protein